MEKLLDKLNDLWVDAGLKLIYVIIIWFVGVKLIKLLIKLIKKGRLFNRLDKSISSFLISFISATLYIILIITIATVIGIPSTSIITLLGSAGVAIGLAMQGGLSNIAGGLVILIYKPFKVGDFIDTHADSGNVKSISLFYTTLVTIDNKIISIPNGNLANSSTVNYSKEKERRLDINIDVSYDNDIEKVKKVLNRIINKDERISKDKDVFVRLTDYKESSMVYTIRVWVNNSDFWNVKFDLLEEIKKEFDKEDISIPYNQLDVHLDNLEKIVK